MSVATVALDAVQAALAILVVLARGGGGLQVSVGHIDGTHLSVDSVVYIMSVTRMGHLCEQAKTHQTG